jgi:hypothetical protein
MKGFFIAGKCGVHIKPNTSRDLMLLSPVGSFIE